MGSRDLIECKSWLGDIVDAKDTLKIGSTQYVEEWQIYQNVLKECEVAKKTQWLDVRGNHGILVLLMH